MPFAIALLAIDVIFIVHAAKTGRMTPWAYLILLLPGVGVIAYILVEIIPEWLGSHKGQQAQRRVISTLNPEKQYRKLADDLDVADTIANRAALAEECLLLHRFGEALIHYE